MDGKISDKLVYSKDTLEERLALVKSLVGSYEEGISGEYEDDLVDYYSHHYNPNLNQNSFLSENTKMGKDLEALADYLLYAKDSNASEDTITDYKKKRNITREASIENVVKVTGEKRDINKEVLKNPKIKVTKEDRKKYEELKISGEIISNLSKMIKTKKDTQGNDLSDKEVRRLMWIRTDIQKDEIAIKNELKGYIRFQNITRSDKDHNALSYIRYDDPEIICILIEEYEELKMMSQNDTYGYMKVILFDLENLIKLTDFDDYVIEAINCKIQNMKQDDIIEILYNKYGVKINKPRLSELTRKTVPKMITETYKQLKEDWVYTFVLKGEYKTCSSCKTPYLAMTKYFSPNKNLNSKNMLRPVCRKCRNENNKKK